MFFFEVKVYYEIIISSFIYDYFTFRALLPYFTFIAEDDMYLMEKLRSDLGEIKTVLEAIHKDPAADPSLGKQQLATSGYSEMSHLSLL